MRQGLLRLGVLAVFLIAAQPVIASSPAIVGEISGVELCTQSACDAAVFTGTCDCRVASSRGDWPLLRESRQRHMLVELGGFFFCA